jgi:polyisoprenoid-binding protein YceI
MSTIVYNLDPTHSEVGFRIKHMMFTNVSGKFNDFNVSLSTEGEDFTTASVRFEAAVSSIDTNNTDRDNHLKSADFFDADNYPKMIFESKKINANSDGTYTLSGDLTIKEVTRPAELKVEYSGFLKDPWGNTKIAVSVEAKINRKDFGLTWNAALETGGVLVGEDVKILAELQFVKQ